MPLIGAFCLFFVMVISGVGQAQDETPLEGYRLGAGDVISIQVFGEPDLSLSNVRLSDSASIAYPLLRRVQAKGKTLLELEQTLTDRLGDGYLVKPRVTVSVSEYRQFFINGEVSRPGGYDFQPGLTVRRAISLAGGLTDRASTNKMFITSEDASDDAETAVELDDSILPGDILTIEESFF